MSEKESTETIVQKLNEARDAYYNSDTPIMTDDEFDELEERLRKIDPDNPYFKTVGVQERGKIQHAIPMLSMQKGKSVDEIIKWIQKLKLADETPFCIMPKIDGLAASCCYENGELQYVATRGNGFAGQDISHVARYIEDIPQRITFATRRVEVRGELYLPKDTDLDTGGRPLRNNCVGLVNRKEKHDDLVYVRLAAFQIAGQTDHKNESRVPAILGADGFNVVPMKVTSRTEEIAEYYALYLKELREKWEFETDGLVITIDDRSMFDEIDSRWVVDHHHHYAIALKPPSEAAETELKRIDWQVSRQGNVIPVAVFQPVHIGGAVIERASLNNHDNVQRMDIRSGDTLLVERANDVIPYVRENVSAALERQTENSDITLCPACNTTLIKSGVHKRCTNPSCPEINIQKIMYWIRSSQIEQIGEETIRFLYTRKVVSSIRDLYSLRVEDLVPLEGFAEKKSRAIVQEVQQSRSMSAPDLIAKLGIPLVQKKALKKAGIRSIRDFLSFNDDTYVIGRNIIEWKSNVNNMNFFNELVETCDIHEESTEKRGKVCMTGKGPKSRKELAADIEASGYEFTDQLTQETDILLTDDPQGSSSKLEKARKYGVQILSYTDFFHP